MKLSFIKLDIGIMNDSKIKIIRKMPDGDKMIVLWVGILCLGMQSGRPGILEVGDGIPFTADTLSAELDIQINTVKLGLETFSKLKMIEFFDNQTIYISNFEKHQELEKIEIARKKTQLRVENHRKRKKLEYNSNDPVTVTVTQCNATDTDKEIDQDKEKDIDIYTEIFEYWNSQNIINHRSINKYLSKIKSSLKAYEAEEIKTAILNYSTILNDEKYYWSYRWGLSDFLNRGLEKFLDFNTCHNNYIVKKFLTPKEREQLKIKEMFSGDEND